MLAAAATGDANTLVEIIEAEQPTPEPNEAVVAVEAISLNRGEINRLQTWHKGWRPGWDFSGEISKAASDGSGPKAGTRVVGFLWEGAWAEYIAAPSSNLAPIPDSLEHEQAATLPVAGLTGLGIIRLGGNLAGKSVLVTGANGGVGRLTIQLAALSGGKVTAVVSSATKTKGLEELGASEIIVGMDSLPGRYDLILDAVGGEYLTNAIAHVAANGDIVTYGKSAGEPATLDPYALFMEARAARIHGFRLGTGAKAEPFAKDLNYLAEIAGSGKIDCGVTSIRPWEELSAAAQAILDRKVSGKTVLKIS